MEARFNITKELAQDLIKSQFPQWSGLQITPVKNGGIDNKTFHLGDNMLIRLPSAKCYIAQVQKEQKWLPYLSNHLSNSGIAIPTPIALGKPCDLYPYHWSIYQWISGESANNIAYNDINLKNIALTLAQFLNQLHNIDITKAPAPGSHNFLRGSHPSAYDEDMRSSISDSENTKNIDNADLTQIINIWEQALESKWSYDPVWIHGDLSPGNILINNQQLTAIIDFGCMGTGDPACDLMIAWTFGSKT